MYHEVPRELEQLAASRDTGSRCENTSSFGTEGRLDPECECSVYMYISVNYPFKRHSFITELFRQTD
jgi:hypothetical protein